MSAQIRSRSLYVAGFCALLGAAACTDDNPLSPSRSVTPRQAQREISVSNAAITLLSIEVGGGKSKQPLLYNLPLADGRSAAALSTPAGEGRQLVVRGYDVYGTLTHQGSAALDVIRVGRNDPLALVLTPTGEGKGVKVSLDVVGEELSGGGSIVVDAGAKELLEGQTIPMKATVYDRDGRRMEVDPRDIHWATSDPRIARVDIDQWSGMWFNATRVGIAEMIAIYKDIIIKRQIPVLADPFVQIAAGFDFTCGRRTSGAVSCWGDNATSQLGTTTTQTCYAPSTTDGCSDRPVSVSGGRTFKSISSGRAFVCGIETSDRISCWGKNDRGQLGIGSLSASVGGPTLVNTTLTFSALTTGGEHACAIVNSVQRPAFCWGMNGTGQLGDNTPGYFTFNPMQQPSPVAVLGGFGWGSIAAGKEHTCGVNTSGRAMCWGSNYYGEIGVGPSVSVRPVPDFVNTPLAPAFNTTFSGPDAYGTCWARVGPIPSCQGANSRGQAGIGGSSTAVGQPASVWGSPPFLNIALGTQHACAIDTSDNLWCWGDNTDGQIGFSIYTWHFLNHPLQVGA